MKYRYKKCNLETGFILLALFLAVFNDAIRIPNTVLSGYRLLLPIILVMSLVYIKYSYSFFMVAGWILVVSIAQNIVFLQVFQLEQNLDFKYGLLYLTHYCSIIAIFILVHLLKIRDEEMFQQLFYKGMVVIGILCMLAYAETKLNVLGNVNFANINDYGCCLAVVFPWYFIQLLYGKWRYLLLCGIIFVELYWGDSKAALVGVLIEIGIITVIALSKKIKEKVIYFLVFIMMILGIALVLSPIRVNGYSIREMFFGMASHILMGELYEPSIASLNYRTNAIIYILRGILQSCFLGIGPGNSGKLLKYAMSEAIGAADVSVLSPHNALLEFFCDCGILAMLISGYIFVKAIKMLFQAKHLEKIDIYFVAFTISFPIWVISSSGIYTVFLIFIVMAWLYENSRRKILWKKI